MANNGMWKVISAIIGSGLICGTAGVGGSVYVQGQNDQEVEMRLTSLEKNKVDDKKFQNLEGLVVNINVNVCKLRYPSEQSDCEQIGFDYYNAGR